MTKIMIILTAEQWNMCIVLITLSGFFKSTD